MARKRQSVAAILLAAGRSARMGSHKLLLRYKGRPIVSWVLAAACASQADPIIVVLGHEAEHVRARCKTLDDHDPDRILGVMDEAVWNAHDVSVPWRCPDGLISQFRSGDGTPAR